MASNLKVAQVAAYAVFAITHSLGGSVWDDRLFSWVVDSLNKHFDDADWTHDDFVLIANDARMQVADDLGIPPWNE